MHRRYDLDWLRVIAFALLMLFHTGMLFTTWDWHVKNLETSDAFDYVMRFLHQWRMPLLFFISGSAIWFALERFSPRQFLVERQRRLLIPLVFGMLVVIPPQVYFERLYHQQQFDSFWDFYRTVFTLGSYPVGNLSWHHLWYIPYIFVYSLLSLPLLVWLRSRSGRSVLERVLGWLQNPWCLCLLIVPAALSDILLRPIWPYDANNLFGDWANFAHKLTFFVAGFVLASGTGVYDMIAARRRWFLAGGVVSLAVLHPIWVGDWHVSEKWVIGYRVLNNFHIWMWILTALGYGRRYLNFNHAFLKSANEAVYPFYILHQTVIIILGYYIVYLDWSIGVKFFIVATATFVIIWGLYVVLRSWNISRVLFGMKWLARQDSRGGATAPAPAVRVAGGGLAALVLMLGLTSCSPRGEIVTRTVQAPSLSRNVLGISDRQPVTVYLPPGYRDEHRRFPVLYLLPNFKTEVWRYTGGAYQGFHLNEALDRQARSAKAQQMIVVVPNALHFLGGSWYMNSPLTGNWEDYITSDLVSYIDSHFRTIPSADARGVTGHGMGAVGALNLAFKHPEVFGSVYAMSPPVFDPNGLRDFGVLSERQISAWQVQVQKWAPLDDHSRRTAFRDYMQTRLNNFSHESLFEGLFVSYAAAVAPDLSLPYPHIAFPDAKVSEGDSSSLLAKFQSGLGDWPEKLERYCCKGPRLHSITIEYGKDDEYQWIRRGAEYLSGLMRSRGVANTLEVHEGGHDSTLGRRLETGMLPAMAEALSATGQNVAQVSKPAVSRVSKPADPSLFDAND
jgi:S-formylglutathione hydrolase FrmB